MEVRCLIVDDNDRFLEIARGVLERDGIVVVGVASDGTEALERVDALRPDVALVDVYLGEECGFELADMIADEMQPKPVVILVSTYPEEDFTDVVADCAAVGFLPKSELSGAAIRSLLDTIGQR